MIWNAFAVVGMIALTAGVVVGCVLLTMSLSAYISDRRWDKDRYVRIEASRQLKRDLETMARWFAEDESVMLAFDFCRETIEDGNEAGVDVSKARERWRHAVKS